jgi:hypothetical protein
MNAAASEAPHRGRDFRNAACPLDPLVFSCAAMLNTGRAMRQLHPRGWACLALAGAWLLFYGTTIFSSRVPYERDILVTVLPLRHYLLERLRSGQFPQWYPYELMGVPFAGSLVASPFHPQLLLFLLLGPAVGTKWSILLGALFGLCGAYRFARELKASRTAAVAAAYVFGLGGYGVSLVSNPPFLIPFMTAPWMLGALHRVIRRDRRTDIALLAFWWALLFLGGDAQLFLECGVIGLGMLFAYRGSRSAWIRFGGASVIAAALISAELIPALASEDESIRAFWKPSAALASLWALNPVRLIDFLLPRFVPPNFRLEFGQLFEGQGDLFVPSLFVGGTALALALAALWKSAPGALLWASVGALGLALAIGHRGGLLEAWWVVAPPFAKFRIPEKYAGLVAVALIPLVAAGADRLRESGRPFALATAVCGATLLLFALVPGRPLVAFTERWRDGSKPMPDGLADAMATSTHSGLLTTGALLCVLAGLLAFSNDRVQALAIPLLVFCELALGNMGRMPLASASVVEDFGPLATALQKDAIAKEPPPRVIPSRGGTTQKDIADDELVQDIHLWFLPDDAGRSHAVPFQENSSAGRARVNRLVGSLTAQERPLWERRFNVCYRATDRRHPPKSDETVIASVDSPPVSLVRHDCVPRAYLGNALVAANIEQARDRMKLGLGDRDAVWEGGPAIAGGGGTVQWEEAAPEHLRLSVDASAPSALVVSDAFARGWTAMVDGAAVEIYPTNVAARGVAVPAGHHKVEMKYEAPGFFLGVLSSLLGLAGCFGLWFTSRRRGLRMAA